MAILVIAIIIAIGFIPAISNISHEVATETHSELETKLYPLSRTNFMGTNYQKLHEKEYQHLYKENQYLKDTIKKNIEGFTKTVEALKGKMKRRA